MKPIFEEPPAVVDDIEKPEPPAAAEKPTPQELVTEKPIDIKRPLKRLKRELSTKCSEVYNKVVNLEDIPSIGILKLKMDHLHLNSEQRELTVAAFERQQFKKDHEKWVKFYQKI